MNTKNKSLKENFRCLFEESEIDPFGAEDLELEDVESVTKKTAFSGEKKVLKDFSNPIDTKTALITILTIEFICAKATNMLRSLFDSDLTNQTISTYSNTLQAQKSNYISSFEEVTKTNAQAKILYRAYANAVKKLDEENINKIILSEGNISLKSKSLKQKLENALTRSTASMVNIEAIYKYFTQQLESIATISQR